MASTSSRCAGMYSSISIAVLIARPLSPGARGLNPLLTEQWHTAVRLLRGAKRRKIGLFDEWETELPQNAVDGRGGDHTLGGDLDADGFAAVGEVDDQPGSGLGRSPAPVSRCARQIKVCGDRMAVAVGNLQIQFLNLYLPSIG